MPTFYKGVGVGTFWHANDPRTNGFSPRSSVPTRDVWDLMRHIAGDTISPFVSLTRSYGVAEMYARDFSRLFPTAHNPAYVYTVELNDPLPRGLTLHDPIVEVADLCKNDLLVPFSYHHDGDMNFLLGVVNPVGYYHHLSRAAPQPKGSVLPPHLPHLSVVLQTLVRALRDSEAIVHGKIPADCIGADRYEIF